MFAAGKTSGGGGTPVPSYQISRSLRFNSADTTYLNRTPASSTNQKTWTWSAWVKRSTLGTQQTLFSAAINNGEFQQLVWDGSVNVNGLDYVLYTGAVVARLSCTQVFRDPSAWYHIVVAWDTTQATASNRVKLYVNGVQVTAFSEATYPPQNTDGYINRNILHEIGRTASYGTNLLNSYMTEVNFIDGQALTPSSFGETNAQTGVWQPKAYSGSYGTNGFYLNFSDNSNTTAATLGADYSGNGNNWTPNNFSVTAGAGNDSLVDVPTLYGADTGVGGTVRGNYATLNPLANSGNPLSNGNLDIGQALDQTTFSTIGMSTGKWYCEVTLNSIINGANIGIASYRNPGNWLGASSLDYAYATNGLKYNAGGGSAYGATWTTGDTIGIAFDADAGTLVFYKNGVSQGTAFSGLTNSPYFFGWGGNSATGTFNFGQRPFAYTAPSGFKALCTQNLPTPTIGATSATVANKYFDVSIWSGTGSSISITNSGSFQPDWVWAKSRSNAGTNNILVDAVRGTNYWLTSDSTSSESALGSPSPITAFNSGGFSGDTSISGSGRTYVGWQWKANGSGSSNTAGSITSTVSANTTSGFSVVTFTKNATTNETIGHGLGVAPSMIIVKARQNAGFTDWAVWHTSIGIGNYIVLNSDAAVAASSAIWNNTNPTSTVFSMGTAWTSTVNMVAYCFAPIAGYSAFGSFTGNASADGPFVYTGFRPAYIMLKNSGNTYFWYVFDNKRNTYNVTDTSLYPNDASAEGVSSVSILDILSNGFKMRGSSGGTNPSGSLMIYAAFAESPFKYSLAR